VSGWSIAWVWWIIAFGAIEGPALISKVPGATLSEHFWSWFSITTKSSQWRLRRFCLLAGLAWLALHLLTGGAF